MDLEEIVDKTMKFIHSEGEVFAQKIKVISYDIEKSNIEIGEEKETWDWSKNNEEKAGIFIYK